MNLGTTHILEPHNDHWPDVNEAAKMVGVSRRTFDRMVKRGLIDRYRGKDTKYRYNPADLERLKEDVDVDQDEVIDALVDSPTAALLSQAYAHNHIMMTQMRELVTELRQTHSEQVTMLSNRCRDLESSKDDMVRAREAALNEQHERDMTAKQLAAAEERKSKAIDGIFKLAPIALATRGASKFMSSITPMQLQMALGLGTEFWTPEQLEILRKMAEAKPLQLSDEREDNATKGQGSEGHNEESE